eukprot:TRINITY_DN12454_c0_g1_i1.p1 TRINITY_DN12454_c0_g1~~TRINITY_DN12454_c0_g1_i1.p1  ORF type:complete len:508 (+),score=109.36 TRINITY_DN12454_c0_g1_i1:179-1525(+)
MRVAGGWVRDKVMGLESHDIDIVIPLMGMQFAETINKYLQDTGEEWHTIGHIKANPELNKLLDVATVKIRGLWVDLVNLRSDSTGNPLTTATPREDAHLRDLTINSLFYNINTKMVEDYTGGLADIQGRILRTPLPPAKTFSDDPNRLMRCFRFASKYNYKVSESILKVAPLSSSQLANAVSRERIGAELLKILDSPFPAVGLEYILTSGIAPSIFALPPPLEMTDALIQHVVSSFKFTQEILPLANFPINQQRTLLFASILLQFHHLKYTEKKKEKNSRGSKGKCGGGGEEESACSFVLRVSLHLSNSVHDEQMKILNTVDTFATFFARSSSPTRKELGLAIRAVGPNWPIATLLATTTTPTRRGSATPQEAISQWSQLSQLATSLSVTESYSLSPMVNGKEVLSILNVPPGSIVGTVLAAQIPYLLENPTVTKPDVIDWIKRTFAR